MTDLKKIFEKQLKLQKKLGYSKKELKFNQEYINLNLLACYDELGEIQRETAWKNPTYIKYGWKKGQDFNMENYKEEIIDLFHFIINLCISANMDHKELLERYLNKNKINQNRKKGGY